MKVVVKGQGEVSLTQQHFVATGGQASVYVRNGIAYKVYTDPKNAIPHEKFRALSAIKDACVIKPSQMLLDARSAPIGYTMNAVADNLSLCQLFTKAFRDRERVTNDHIVNIAAKLRTHVTNVHGAGVLIVDLNEFNVLVPKTLDETYLIDVDSYQTAGYPATVIMPSVRDWSSKQFTELSDWFSYGVLAFQLFVGVHPYKGTHPGSASIDKDKRLEHRMRGHVSAFRTDVSLPKCCYPFDAIPQGFRDWLRAVLDDGKRVAPPDPLGGPAATLVTQFRAIASTGKLTITEVRNFAGWNVAAYAESGPYILALIQKNGEIRVQLNDQLIGGKLPKLVHGTTLMGFTPKLDKPVALNLHQGKLSIVHLDQRLTEVLGMRADELAKSGDRFYIRSGGEVLEIEFTEFPDKVIVTASHCVAYVLAMASTLYEGCVIQNMLGSVFVSLFPRRKAGYQVRIPELDGYKVVDAKFAGGVLMVVGARDGLYDRLVFRFDAEFTRYGLRTVPDVDPSGLNFITLSTGICVAVTEDEHLEAFTALDGKAGIKLIEDAALGNDMRLLEVGGKAGFARGDKVYQIALSPSSAGKGP